MATISLTKEGAKCKVTVSNSTTTPYVNLDDIIMNYNSNDTVSINIKSDIFNYYDTLPIANVTIGGVVITSQAVFDTQVAAVFPNAGGSSAITTDSTLTGDGSVASPLSASSREATANKDASGGYAGLTLLKINFKNALNTFISFFTNANTAARTYTFQDRDGTIADNTDLALKANLGSANVFTTNGALSTPVNKLNGTWITGGSASTTTPQSLIEPSGATSSAWNTAGTGLGVNAASGFTGNLADFQLNGASVAKFASNGIFTLVGSIVQSGTLQSNATATAANINFNGANGTGLSVSTSTAIFTIGGRSFQARALFGGTVSTVATASTDIANAIFGASAQTEATSGTHALVSNVVIKTPAITNGSATTTDMQALYVDDAPSGGANNWSANIGTTKFRGLITLAATATTGASFNIPAGTAPTSPVDGDVWREDNTNTGLKIRINGVTKTITVS